jgi:dihydrofolate synthase/folylpolyglutamate synthase
MKHATLADWLAWQETLHPKSIDLGLERLQLTLARLNWRPPACPVITVAGTNGKGSTVAMLARIFAEQGYRTATFTSPHLLDYNERICIAERPISDASLIAAFERIDAARGAETLTFFEFNALAALVAFETAKPDVVILEVGMGGRLDAVNVVDADVAVITSIALDHCEWLGNDLETIGREKAGIMRRGRPAIYGDPLMPHSIATVAKELEVSLLRLEHDFHWQRDGDDWDWHGLGMRLTHLPAPALHGEIQYNNASTVIAVLTALRDRIPVEHEAIVRGLRTVRLAGRFQYVSNPHSDAQWVVDVAHNPAAAQTLASQLKSAPVAGRTIAVCAILGDKDIERIGAVLQDCVDEWVVCGLDSPRALPPRELAARLRASGIEIAAEGQNVARACRLAEQSSRKGDRVVVFGSFLTVAAALEYLAQSANTFC